MSEQEFSTKLVNLEHDLRNFASIYTKRSAEIDDLVQETFYKALTNKDKFRENTNFKAWAFTILKNTFINHYRKESRYVTGDHEVKFSSSNLFKNNYISEISETDIRLKEIKNKVNQLDKKIKIPFKMYIGGYKYKEIAQYLNIPLGTVKSRIFSARQELEAVVNI